MKTMRLIDADALISEYDRVHVGAPGGARKLMEEAPTIDAVTVVRCKDCKEFVASSGECGICIRHSELWGKNGFCSCGERKDNETD